MVEVGGVIEGNADEEGALPEGVVHRPLERRNGSRVLALVALHAIAEVDHIHALVRGVHDSSQESASGGPKRRIDYLHRQKRHVPIDSGQHRRIACDDGRDGGAVPEEVAERQPAGVARRDDVLRHERCRVREVHEPGEVRKQVVDAGVDDRDLDIARAEVAGRPRRGREHGPQIPLPCVEPGRRRRRGRIGGSEGFTHSLVGSGAVGRDVLIPQGGQVGLHGADVRAGRQLGRGGP